MTTALLRVENMCDASSEEEDMREESDEDLDLLKQLLHFTQCSTT
jgi:hypothetical protein